MTMHRYALALTAGLILAASAPAAEVRGVVTRVDLDKKEMTLEGRGRGLRGTVFVFTLSDQTQVMFGDQAGALSDLEPGRRVRVDYEAADGRQVAQVIRVQGGPHPAAPAATVTPPPPAGDVRTGVLRRVSYSDRELVIVAGPKGAEAEITIAVPESARVVKDGKDATLEDLKEGDTATIQVEAKDGRLSAVQIQVGAGVVAVVPPSKPDSKMIPRLRILLKLADQLLEQMQNKDDGK